MKELRLFDAIGAADPILLERSEKRQKSGHGHWWALAAAAACLAVVLLVLPRTEPASVEDTAAADTAMPEDSGTDGTEAGKDPTEAQPLRLLGSEAGELHVSAIQYGPEQTASPEFLIYINEEVYRTSKTGEAYVIRPIAPLPEEYPTVELEIVYQADCTAEEAEVMASEDLSAEFKQVQETEWNTVSASNGEAWDDAQAETYVVEDGQGGCFLLTARYFTEATEGHGVRFRDMIGTFQVILPGQSREPDWMTALRETAYDLIPTLLAGDASVSAVDFTVDDDQTPSSAIVSVQHKENLEDSCDYLTMELAYEAGKWTLIWSGLEK